MGGIGKNQRLHLPANRQHPKQEEQAWTCRCPHPHGFRGASASSPTSPHRITSHGGGGLGEGKGGVPGNHWHGRYWKAPHSYQHGGGGRVFQTSPIPRASRDPISPSLPDLRLPFRSLQLIRCRGGYKRGGRFLGTTRGFVKPPMWPLVLLDASAFRHGRGCWCEGKHVGSRCFVTKQSGCDDACHTFVGMAFIFVASHLGHK